MVSVSRSVLLLVQSNKDQVVIVLCFVPLVLEGASGPDKDYAVFVSRLVILIVRSKSRRDKLLGSHCPVFCLSDLRERIRMGQQL